MNNNIAVSLKNISKKYRLFGSIKERFKEALHPLNKKYHKEFSALSDVSLDIQKGTTVGLIGRNGSGKTTLLEIICSVLQPSTGSVEVNGRISALLELGTGFNPEFTGRDNVVLNGTLMGYTKKEIEERIHLIEEFADIGQFFDQPVRIYSSGMFVRLAFATAINIDPDILIIDEALSVGDARFQQKCFSKFHEFKKSGKTILFVTHDSNAIIRHCHTAMLLEKGEIIRNGPPSEVVSDYMKLVMSKNSYRKSVSEPQLIKAIGDYNIVFFDHFYYALPKNAGKFDFYSTDPKTVSGVIYGESLNKVEHQINSDRQLKNKTMDSMPRKLTERERFFLYDETDDACNKRINYNKNEYRFGNNRAKIIDYLIESDHIINPVHLSSGKTIDLFIKIKYNTDLEKPLVGFNIKTVDGLILYGSNTRHLNHDLDPVTSGQIKIYQFTVKMDLAPGDLFIELGCSEKLPDRDIAADIRRNIIHVKLTETSIYEGLVELPMKFREVKETKDIENKVNYRTLIK